MKLVAAGIPPQVAANLVARQAKGNIAEVDQSASYTLRAGALGRESLAYPNPIANDPLHDVFLVRGRRKRRTRRGVQVKVVLRLSKKHVRKYRYIVTSAPIPTAIPAGTNVEDRLRDAGHEARKLVANDMHSVATDALKKQIAGEPAVSWLDILWAAFKAGGIEALVSAAISLGSNAIKSWWAGSRIDWVRASRAAIVRAIRAGARTFLQTLLLAKQRMKQFSKKYSAALIHAIGTAAVVLGALAEVMVEVVADAIEWFRGRLSFSELLRRIPVHILTAGGSALGVLLAAAVTEGAPWWTQMVALVLLGSLGAHGGRLVAQELVPQVA